MLEGNERIKFDLPIEYARAIRARASFEGVYPRDVVIAALDAYLAPEIAEAKKRLTQQGAGSGEAPAKPMKKKIGLRLDEDFTSVNRGIPGLAAWGWERRRYSHVERELRLSK